jgi:hypothetical protein
VGVCCEANCFWPSGRKKIVEFLKEGGTLKFRNEILGFMD